MTKREKLVSVLALTLIVTGLAAVNTTVPSTMVFRGSLTDAGGYHTGDIAATAGSYYAAGGHNI